MDGRTVFIHESHLKNWSVYESYSYGVQNRASGQNINCVIRVYLHTYIYKIKLTGYLVFYNILKTILIIYYKQKKKFKQ